MNLSKKEKFKELKVITVGDEKIGKTTLLLSFFRGKYTIELDATLEGVNLFRKELSDVEKLSEYALNIWDVAGHQRFYEIFPILTTNMHAVILIIQKKDIELTIRNWMIKINQFFSLKMQKFLICLEKEGENFDSKYIDSLKNKFEFANYYILNSKSFFGVSSAFKGIMLNIINSED